MILFVALLLLPAAVRADDRTDRVLMLSLMAWADYDHSAGSVTPGDTARELNPILADHPTRQDMLLFGISGIAALVLAVEILPESWGDVLLDSAIASEQWNVEDNRSALQGQKRRVNAMPLIISFRF